jgi:DHA3 family macrolide efflux protein-like MFS transporter
MGLFGVAVPLFNTPSAVLIQEHVEENYLGRVFSILTMLMTSVMPLGMLVFGPLAELIRIEWILLGTGALMPLYALRVLGNRRLLEAGRRVEPSVQGGTTPSEPSS